MKRLFLLGLLLVGLWGPAQADAKLILGDTNDTLEVVTASAVSTINVYAAWADITSTTITPGMTNSLVTTATTTTVVAAPAASTQRQVKMLTVYNSHASSSNAISVQVYDGTNRAVLIKYTLLAGETLQWSEDENFRILDAVGNIKGLAFKTPNGDSLVNDTYDAINVNLVNNDTRAAVVTEDGDIPASTATVSQTAAVGYCATVAHGSNPTAVAAAGRAGNKCNRAGVPFVIGGHPNIITKEFTWADADGAQTDAAIVTIGTGNVIAVTSIEAVCDAANTVAVAVRVGFGTASLPALSSKLATGILINHPGIPAGSGFARGHGGGIIGIGADNEDLRITAEDPVTGSCSVMVSYYTVES